MSIVVIGKIATRKPMHHVASRFCIALLSTASVILQSYAQIADSTHRYYFYNPLPYGSEATYNPLSLAINGGFDEFQTYGKEDNLYRTAWRSSATNVWRNITDPFTMIRIYGATRFVDNEIIPTSLNKDHDQWFPNYTLHLLGAGMDSRKVAEWYDAHGYPVPYVFSIVTTMTYHFVNEIIENGTFVGVNVDPIPDLLVFDPLGIVLFSFDGVAEFFSSTVIFNDWSYQPALSFGPLAVRNIGQNFVMKYPITKSGGTSIFYYFGNFGVLGLSLKLASSESISFGGGVVSKGNYILGFNALTESIYTGPMAGIYYDRNNSLLASLVVMDSKKDIVRANVFPGIISVGGFSPGVFFSYGVGGSISAGFTAHLLPVGLGLHI